jgi:hypothetical protein
VTGLPDVSLHIPAPCPADLAGHPARPAPARRPADGPVGGDGRPAPGDARPAPGDGRTDGTGDARIDGAGDARHDARGDARRGVLVVPADLPGAPRVPAWLRAWITARHWGTAWWQSAERAITNPRGPYHAQPESLADHDAYRRSRAWIPPGHEGKILGPAGDAYHRSFAKFGIATGYAWAWVWARPMRLLITAAVLGTVLGFWLG